MVKKQYVITAVLVLLASLAVFIGLSFSISHPGEIESVSFQTDDYDQPSSFKAINSAKWVAANKAEATLDISTIEKNKSGRKKDIILVMDTSGSMLGEKMDRVREDTIELINNILENQDNRIALIEFNSNAWISFDLTNDKQALIDRIIRLRTTGETNYDVAYRKLLELMSDYTKEEDRDITTIFLTDGFPNWDTPNEVSKYEFLKERYPYMTINGIQYEMGIDLIPEIKNITDEQWIANRSTLHNVLFEAALNSLKYEKFKYDYYINDQYFYLNSIDDVKVNHGTVSLSEENGIQKVTWVLDGYLTGISSTLKMNLDLKDEYHNVDGLYPTNKKENVEYQVEEEETKTFYSELTPILANRFSITYYPNTPPSCNLGGATTEQYYVYDKVNKWTTKPECEGYLFRGWDIDGEDVKDIQFINDDTFYMPGHDVSIRAVWSSQNITKNMDGEVHAQENTLYRVLQDAAKEGTYAKEYTGPHRDSYDRPAIKNIYHWYADKNDDVKGTKIPNMYNVVFANSCWRMIRTTDIGGVRLLYNGEYDPVNKCATSRPHKDVLVADYAELYFDYSNNYYYGTDYTYDANTKKFTLTGDVFQKEITSTNYEDIYGLYTCKDSYKYNDCSVVYKVVNKTSNRSLVLLEYDPNDYHMGYTSIVGYGPFNYGDVSGSLAGSGYMYNEYYKVDYRYFNSDNDRYSFGGSQDMVYSVGIDSGLYVADSAVLDHVSGSYTYYKLVNPTYVSDYSNLNQFVGKFVSKYSGTSSTINYVLARSGSRLIYRQDSLVPSNEFTFANSYIKNADGTYTLQDTITIPYQTYMANDSSYAGMYFCPGTIDTTCNTIRKVTTAGHYDDSWWTTHPYDKYYLYYQEGDPELVVGKGFNGNQLTDTITIDKYEFTENYDDNYSDYKYTCGTTSSTCEDGELLYITDTEGFDVEIEGIKDYYYFGSDATWDGTKYTLVDPRGLEVYDDKSLFSTHHYFCLEGKVTSCTNVAYALQFSYDDSLYYIIMKNGETDITKIRDKQIKENVHDSYIKASVDEFYERHLIKYEQYLEDTIYCNNRQSKNPNNSYSKNGNILGGYSSNPTDYDNNYVDDISCAEETDMFAVANPKAILKHPINLLTFEEFFLIKNSKAREVVESFTTGTTYLYSYGSNSLIATYYGSYYGSTYYGTVPAITLKYSTTYTSGTGTREDPYMVDTSEVDG